MNFIKLLHVSKDDSIIDVGGAPKIWLGSGLEQNVTIVNLLEEKSVDAHGITYLPGDARDLKQIKDNQFDVAFSNSVIEHVGDYTQQQKFAKEIRRIASRYWVQTPYKHFPIEPHFLFPFFQYLPSKARLFIGTRWKFSHYNQFDVTQDAVRKEIEQIRLLSNKEMKTLFHDGTLYKEHIMGMLKSIVMYKG